MPLATRATTNSPNPEPKTKRAKTVKKVTRTSSRAATAAAAAAAAAASTTTSSTENDDLHTDTAVPPPQPPASSTKTRSKSTSNGADPTDKPTSVANEDAMESDNLNQTNGNIAEDTIMTDITNQTSVEPTSLTINTTTAAGSVSLASTSTATNGPAASGSSAAILINEKTRTKPGFVLSVGENLSNQLGFSLDVDSRKKPQIVKLLECNGSVVQVAAGGMHSACLTDDGVVYTFGCNDEFALGRASDEDIDKVELPEKSIEITAGDSHTAALSETGVVYAWGTFRDGSGVLGLEQKKIAKIPMKFKLKEKIAKISSGADHLVFLTTTGQVYTAGNSEHGQLGRISKYNSCRGGRRGCDMILEPGLVRIGKRKELNGSKTVEDIWTSSYCTYLKLKDSDSIIAFGLNNCYQLGAEDMENRYQPDLIHSLKFDAKLKKVIGGMHHTLFLDTLGNVYSMGSHRYGCLGLGKIETDVAKPNKITELADIVDIAANTNTSYAIDKHGKCFSWGTNYSKQLGQDDEEDYYVPTLVKSKHLDSRENYAVSIGGQHSLFIVSEEKEKDSDAE